jgi:hypothetical protein
MLLHGTVAAALCFAGALSAQTPATPVAPELQLSNWQDRWDLYVQRTYSWKRAAMAGAETLFSQPFEAEKCGRPPYCLPHRYGALLARRTARTTVELGAGALLGEDTRRTRSNLTGLGPRIRFALKDALRARTGDGHWRPAYSRFIGTVGGIVVSRATLGRPLRTSYVAEAFGWSIGDNFQDALLNEFAPDFARMQRTVLRRILSGVRDRGSAIQSSRP